MKFRSFDFDICDQILENGSKSHICILLHFTLPHGQHFVLQGISYYNVEFIAEILLKIKEIFLKYMYVYRNIFEYIEKYTELHV